MSDPTPAPAAATPPKSKKKLLIVIAAAVVLLGGGGAGAWFFMHEPAEEGAEEDDMSADAEQGDKEKAKKGKKDKKDKKEKKKEGEGKLPAQFVGLDPPFVVNFEPGSSARFLQIAAQLMTRDPHMVEFLEAQQSRSSATTCCCCSATSKSRKSPRRKARKRCAPRPSRPCARSSKPRKAEPEAVEAVYFTSFVMQ